MKKIVLFLAILTLFISCKEEAVKKPERLIDKDVMVDIMYDISILDAIRYQNPTSIDSFKINARDFVYKKYKVDSVQFVKSNIYYSSDYQDYKLMFDQVNKRIDRQKKVTDSLIKLEEKKLKKVKKTKSTKLKLITDTLVREKKQFIKKKLVKESAIKKESLK